MGIIILSVSFGTLPLHRVGEYVQHYPEWFLLEFLSHLFLSEESKNVFPAIRGEC